MYSDFKKQNLKKKKKRKKIFFFFEHSPIGKSQVKKGQKSTHILGKKSGTVFYLFF